MNVAKRSTNREGRMVNVNTRNNSKRVAATVSSQAKMSSLNTLHVLLQPYGSRVTHVCTAHFSIGILFMVYTAHFPVSSCVEHILSTPPARVLYRIDNMSAISFDDDDDDDDRYGHKPIYKLLQ